MITNSVSRFAVFLFHFQSLTKLLFAAKESRDQLLLGFVTVLSMIIFIFRSSSLKNASGWRESSTIDYHDRPSPMRRISSPTLYEFHNAKDTVSTTRVLWESHPEDSDDDFTESSEGEPEIDENDEPTTEKRGENGEDEEDTELRWDLFQACHNRFQSKIIFTLLQ